MAFGEPQEPQAGAVALLRMQAVGQDGRGEGGCLGADGARPVRNARGRPFEMALMGLGHVGGEGRVPTAGVIAPMGADPLAAVEDLDGGGRDTHLHGLVDEGVGDGGVVPVALDVVVEVDAAFFHSP